MRSILVIDDDPDICLLLQRFLQKRKFDVSTAYSLKKGLASFRSLKQDVVLCDFRLPDGEGLEMIKRINALRPQSQIIIMTGYSDVKVAVNCIKQGAFDYVTKPIHPEEILHTIVQALEKGEEVQHLPKGASTDKRAETITSSGVAEKSNKFVVGVSPQSRHVANLTDLVAPTNMSVIIKGETGTGKEYVASLIHSGSKRSDKPFIPIDCGALPREIAASELFGHKKGAFTGAVSDKVGAFELADGGTLFLDEIANLDYSNQVKLLRVLQEMKIRRVGDTKERKIDVRIIVATNENLWKKALKGEFREDLYHRLNEFTIDLAPLRDRVMEIPQYARHFIAQANRELDKSVTGIDRKALAILNKHRWHGNLRELKNVVKRAVLLAESSKIKEGDLPHELKSPSMETLDEGQGAAWQGSFRSLKEAAESAERVMILRTLEQTAYNKSKTADRLKVDRKTLYNKIRAYNIDLKG